MTIKHTGATQSHERPEAASYPCLDDVPTAEDVLDALAALFTAPAAERMVANLNPSLEAEMEDWQ